MAYIIGFIVLLLSLSMFFIDREHKFMLILISSMCLDFASFPFVSFGTANQMICLFFFISEIRNLRLFYRRIKGTPIITAITIASISTIVTIITSPHAHNLTTIIGLICGDLITKYFVIGYIFASFKESYIRPLYRVFYKCLIVLTIFGLLNLITKNSIALSLVGNSFGSEIASLDRMRVVALFKYPFDYGYISVISLLMTIYASHRHYLSQRIIAICYICCIIGIVICGCRTIMVLAAFALLAYYALNYSFFKATLSVLAFIILGAVSYFTVPPFQEKVNSTLTAFSMEESQEESASSLLGRIIQYDTALSYISNDKLLGRGYRFFIEDLGYNKNGNGMYDLPREAMPLLGLEGAIMKLLLENGYFGVFCYLLYYLVLLRFGFKLLKRNKLSTSMAIISLSGFILYGNMTGELGSAIITLFTAGIFLKIASIHTAQKYYVESATCNSTRNRHSGIQKHVPAGNA